MQVEVVRHHGGPDDADGDVERRGIGQARDEAVDEGDEGRLGQDHFHQEGDADGGHQAEDDRLQLADPEPGEGQQDQHVEGGDGDPREHRQPEQEVQGDGRADHLGHVAAGDGQFSEQVEGQVDRGRVGFPGSLGQVALAHDSQPGGQALQEDGHEVRHQQDPQEAIAVAAAAGDVGGPVARIHVTHGDQQGRAGDRQPLFPARPRGRHHDGARTLPQGKSLGGVGRGGCGRSGAMGGHGL